VARLGKGDAIMNFSILETSRSTAQFAPDMTRRASEKRAGAMKKPRRTRADRNFQSGLDALDTVA
jgi:hypothetical protein